LLHKLTSLAAVYDKRFSLFGGVCQHKLRNGLIVQFGRCCAKLRAETKHSLSPSEFISLVAILYKVEHKTT